LDAGLAAVVVIGDEGQQGNLAGALDGAGKGALMQGAGTGLAAGADFAFFGYKAAKHIGGFVINFEAFISTELANFGSGDIAPPIRRLLVFQVVII